MATNTKQARRDAERKRRDYENSYRSDFASKFHNAVKVVNLPVDLPKRYLLRTLLNKGGIAFDKQTGLYLPFVYGGIDVYGEPKWYNLIGFNGYTLMRNASEVVILRANDLLYPTGDYIDIQVQKLVNFDMAIEQNLEAIKTMTIMEVKDHQTLLSLANLAEARQIGATIVFENKSANLADNLTVSSTGAQYLVTSLLEDRNKVYNETLMHLGISSANIDKAERVQSIEVTASQGVAIESIKTLIDTFNHDAKVGGLDIRLEYNTALMEDRELEVNAKETENKGVMQDA